MRGSHGRLQVRPAQRGIIPAHAGLTTPCLLANAYGWDHPRACGAHLEDRIGQPLMQGSSPRMRGSQMVQRLIKKYHGIIPAHAGLTESA